MNISSMTGFIRHEGSFSEGKTHFSFVFEIKSVNAKGLEIKTKLPQGFDDLEYEIKNTMAEFFSRGTFNVALNLKNESETTDIEINRALLNALTKEASDLYIQNSDIFSKPSPAEILKIGGVVKESEQPLDEKTKARLYKAILKTLNETLKKLKADRQAEGKK